MLGLLSMDEACAVDAENRFFAVLGERDAEDQQALVATAQRFLIIFHVFLGLPKEQAVIQTSNPLPLLFCEESGAELGPPFNQCFS